MPQPKISRTRRSWSNKRLAIAPGFDSALVDQRHGRRRLHHGSCGNPSRCWVHLEGHARYRSVPRHSGEGDATRIPDVDGVDRLQCIAGCIDHRRPDLECLAGGDRDRRRGPSPGPAARPSKTSMGWGIPPVKRKGALAPAPTIPAALPPDATVSLQIEQVTIAPGGALVYTIEPNE